MGQGLTDNHLAGCDRQATGAGSLIQRLGRRVRRCSRFTLRGVLAVVTVICIWASLNANRAHQQQRAVAVITRLGGKVAYDRLAFAEDAGFLRYHIRRLLFYSFCEPVVAVHLFGRDVRDDDLVCLADLPDVGKLDLGTPNVTSNGMKHLRGLGRLGSLRLFSTGIDDTAMEHLASLHNLRELELYGTGVGDEGVRRLRELTSLETLGLVRTKITDRALESLAKFPRLVRLYVAGTGVTDAGLRHLQQTQTLRELLLTCFTFRHGRPGTVTCPVTADGVAEFSRKVPQCKVGYWEVQDAEPEQPSASPATSPGATY